MISCFYKILFFPCMLCAVVSVADGASNVSPFGFWERYRLNYDYAGSQLKDHIYGRSLEAFSRGDAGRDRIDSAEALRARQNAVRLDFLQALGGLPPLDTPLNAVTTGTVKADGFTIENVVFESRPQDYVTANLYLPDGLEQPSAAVLLLMGHSGAGRLSDHYQSVAQTLARAGLVVLAMDPIGQGERLGYLDPETKEPLVNPGTREHDYVGIQTLLAGDGLARYFLHDAMRGVDYLISRSEVDQARIGVTGTSGGGTQTMMMMMADPRIAAAAPSSSLMSRESYLRTGKAQDAEQLFFGFTGKGYDHEDFLLAMAPRPVCVLGARFDFFPIEGTRRSVERTKRFWELLGEPDGLTMFESDTLHGYAPPHAIAAAKFFSRVLLGEEADMNEFVPKPYPPEVIHSTRSGQVGIDYTDAQFVFDANAKRLEALKGKRQALGAEALRAQAQEWLEQKVFEGRQPVDMNPRLIISEQPAGDYVTDMAFWWSQPQLVNMGVLIRHKDAVGKEPQGVTVALWDEGTNAIGDHLQWLKKECEQGRAVFVVNLSGMGALQPDRISDYPMKAFYGTFHKLADDLSWLGDSLVALRTFELIRSLDILPRWDGLNLADIRFYGHGRTGVHGKLAAAIEPRIREVLWEEGFTFSDWAGARFYPAEGAKEFVLPGVLTVFDINEI